MPDFSRVAPFAPLVGAMLGLLAALALGFALALRLPPLAAAAFCLAVTALVTGAFHEDGLADAADGFGGGRTIERRLEIMKDSRIGAFGATALALALLLRAALLAGLAERPGAGAAMAALLASGAFSRAAALAPLTLLAPARQDGAAWAASRPTPGTFALTLAVGAAVALAALLPPGFTAPRIMIALCAGLAAALVMTALSRRAIGGQTGDVAGAAQQLAEIAFLAALLAAAQ